MSTIAEQTLQDLSKRFTWVDYLVFLAMLIISACIGMFYGCGARKMSNTKDFLLAGKSMTTFPVAMSLIASFMSAITLLGTPSEVYSNGFVYWMIGLSYFIVMPTAIYLYLPVFWDLQVTSAYEYLELRFHKSIRVLGSLIFIVQMSMYMAIVVYAPALALSQVTGVNVYLSVSLICFVCIFYTTLGGMKAVLWTDAVQVITMYVVMVLIIGKGVYDQGGFLAVWQDASVGGRTTLVDWDLHPTTRHTFWTLVIGGTFTWMTIYCVNQAQVQRYLCVQEKKMATNALWINLFALFFLMIICAFGGLVIYSKYGSCDPTSSKLVSKPDQLLPLFVMDTLGHLNGIPGLFVAGIFSGALSTVSSGMNSLAAITLEDFLKGLCFPNMADKTATIVSKALSFGFGILTFILVFVAEQLGDILSAALSIFGMLGGPLCGVFSLGMFVPWANTIGAFTGTIFSLCFTFWIGIGYQVAVFSKEIEPTKLPVNITGCAALNLTAIEPSASHIVDPESKGPLLAMYQLSYLWYSCVGFFSVIVIGTLVSLISGPTDPCSLNSKLVSPGLLWFRKISSTISNIGIYYDENEEIGLKNNKSTATLGEDNYVYPNLSVPYREGQETSSKL